MTSVLFVCLGNICRSPLAEGTFAYLVDAAGLQGQITYDSAGNGAWHEGDPPDPRAVRVAAKNNIDISNQKSRPVHLSDFTNFDLILCMDHDNITNVNQICPANNTATIDLFLNHAHGTNTAVPDPYYGGGDGFERVFSQIMEANQALLEKLR